MKKTLIALAAVAASSAALAQSSVTLFGIMDVNVRHTSTKIGGAKTSLTEMGKDGTASSRLGFRGVEDLGGGMSASFWLEATLTPDNGTAENLSFQRRSTVSLSGGFGEVRLGRDYVPTFWNHTVYDPFGTNGLGNSIFMWGSVVPTLATNVRSNNLISYFTPNMGGFQAQLSYGFKEVDTGTSASDYQGLRLTYAAGPLSVGFATASEGNTGAADNRRTNVGASYDFGFIKPMFNYATAKDKSTDIKSTNLMLGLTAPVGPGLIKTSYTRTEREVGGVEVDGNQIALGYEYGLSKRTALYGNVARVSADAGLLNAAEYKRTGFEVGIRHAF